MKNSIIILALSALLFACHSQQPLTPNNQVVFLGDNSKIQAVEQCKRSTLCHENTLVTSANASATETAKLAYEAKHGILVVDATVGPISVVREDILIARQTHLPKLSVWFMNTEKLLAELGQTESQELLDLEIKEMKDLLASYEMDVETEFYFGQNGLKDLMQYSDSLPPSPRNQAFQPAQKIQVYIYNLTKEEQGSPLSKNDDVLVWISGQVAQAKIVAEHDIGMGDNVDLVLELKQPIQTNAGERFFIQFNQRFNSAGVVAKILE